MKLMNRRTKKCGNCTVCRETANTEIWKETEKKKQGAGKETDIEVMDCKLNSCQ